MNSNSHLGKVFATDTDHPKTQPSYFRVLNVEDVPNETYAIVDPIMVGATGLKPERPAIIELSTLMNLRQLSVNQMTEIYKIIVDAKIKHYESFRELFYKATSQSESVRNHLLKALL